MSIHDVTAIVQSFVNVLFLVLWFMTKRRMDFLSEHLQAHDDHFQSHDEDFEFLRAAQLDRLTKEASPADTEDAG